MESMKTASSSSNNETILDLFVYESIINYIRNYKGLQINCEIDLCKLYPNIDCRTLKSIVSTECTQKMKILHRKLLSNSSELLKKFEKIASETPDNYEILLNMSIKYQVTPTFISRLIIQEKYKNLTRSMITEMTRMPSLIPNDCLAENAKRCIFSDNQEGPIPDFIRRCRGEEYEIKAKKYANEIGLIYFDEENLRRIGFDKTPDLKLALPCLYKGFVINWIESKALFGDIKTHKRYLNQQLISYINRFGSGIVIYWFGYVNDILLCKENGKNLMILNKFPEIEFLEFLQI